MIEVLQILVVVSYIATGIYDLAMGHYFHKNRGFFWEGITCFCLALNINLAYNYSNYWSITEHEAIGLSVNFFLVSYMAVTMCINMHSAYILTPDNKPGQFENIFNFICFVGIAVLFAVPNSLIQASYYILIVFQLVITFVSIVRSIKIAVTNKRKPYYLNAICSALLFIRALLGFVDYLNSPSVIIAKLICSEAYIFLMILMFSAVYRISLKSTKSLSNSLQETITTINHSSNALMCTQMKSDFLYTSLELISQKCDEDPWTAEDLTISLSKYLRHTLNFQQLKGIVPLSNEIELTKAYIAIERERHPNIKFEYNFPNPVPDFHIPPLSIQPLVENAIEHAFDKDAKDAMISISISDFKEYYHIDVSDNGKGMDEAQAGALTNSLNDTARIGVYSIHTRLINLFGKGLVIQSAPGVGSSISFVVPPNALDYVKEVQS